jgi:hypothetical protein
MMTTSLDVATFVKTLSLLFSSLDLGCSRENPRSGDPGSDDGGISGRLPLLRASFLEQMLATDGAASGETPDLGHPNWMMAMRGVVLLLWGIVLDAH